MSTCSKGISPALSQSSGSMEIEPSYSKLASVTRARWILHFNMCRCIFSPLLCRKFGFLIQFQSHSQTLQHKVGNFSFKQPLIDEQTRESAGADHTHGFVSESLAHKPCRDFT